MLYELLGFLLWDAPGYMVGFLNEHIAEGLIIVLAHLLSLLAALLLATFLFHTFLLLLLLILPLILILLGGVLVVL